MKLHYFTLSLSLLLLTKSEPTNFEKLQTYVYEKLCIMEQDLTDLICKDKQHYATLKERFDVTNLEALQLEMLAKLSIEKQQKFEVFEEALSARIALTLAQITARKNNERFLLLQYDKPLPSSILRQRVEKFPIESFSSPPTSHVVAIFDSLNKIEQEDKNWGNTCASDMIEHVSQILTFDTIVAKSILPMRAEVSEKLRNVFNLLVKAHDQISRKNWNKLTTKRRL